MRHDKAWAPRRAADKKIAATMGRKFREETSKKSDAAEANIAAVSLLVIYRAL
jgi:hypothetical protein